MTLHHSRLPPPRIHLTCRAHLYLSTSPLPPPAYTFLPRRLFRRTLLLALYCARCRGPHYHSAPYFYHLPTYTTSPPPPTYTTPPPPAYTPHRHLRLSRAPPTTLTPPTHTFHRLHTYLCRKHYALLRTALRRTLLCHDVRDGNKPPPAIYLMGGANLPVEWRLNLCA